MLSATAATSDTLNAPDVRANILAVGQRIMARKGFTAVGLTELLTSAGVPKGSFYHYFGSKEAFGEALLRSYFEAYLAQMDAAFSAPDLSMAARLANYWRAWRENQSFMECEGKCLAVKLGAEVADLSEAMRRVLKQGTEDITARLRYAIEAGVAEGSLSIHGKPAEVAESLYQLWLGASVMVKIVRSTEPFDTALGFTSRVLHVGHVPG